jgi:type IV secretory pathway TraG/TraD family ATPase VirD4
LLDKYIVNFDDLSSLILKSEVDVLFLADEFVKMGKMTQLIKTPDLSRGQKVAVIFIVQALSQPAEVYGAEITKTLNETNSFKFSKL